MPEVLLCLDLGSPNGSLALFRDGVCLENRIVSTGRDHSEQLLPELDALLKKFSISLKDVTGYVLSSGPGSYTGLRVAFATFKAFAMANHAPMFSVSGSEIRALGASYGAGGSWKVQTRMTATKTQEEEFDFGAGASRTIGVDEIPLSAEMIGDYFRRAKSLRRFESEAELIEASPIYAGSSF